MKNLKNVLQMLKSIVLVWLITLLLFVAGDGLSNKLNGYLRKFRNELRGKNKTKRKSFLSKVSNFFTKRVSLTREAVSDYWARGKKGAMFNRDEMGKEGFFNFGFIMMAAPTPENVIIGIIGKIAVANRAIRAKEIIDACASSTLCTIPPADIVIYRGHYDTFVAAIDAPKKAAWKIVVKDQKILLAAFQLKANSDQPNAISILESGSFKIKNVGGGTKQTFQLFDGAASGTVSLIGQSGGKKKHLHDWFISLDKGLTWTRLQPTINSETLATGLTVGMDVWFAHQLIDKNGIVPLSYAKKNIIVK